MVVSAWAISVHGTTASPGLCIPAQSSAFEEHRYEAQPESDECRRLITILIQERPGLRVALRVQERREKRIAHAVVVAGIQTAQLAVVVDCLVAAPQSIHALGETEERPYVRAGLDLSPEFPGVLVERRAEGALAGRACPFRFSCLDDPHASLLVHRLPRERVRLRRPQH